MTEPTYQLGFTSPEFRPADPWAKREPPRKREPIGFIHFGLAAWWEIVMMIRPPSRHERRAAGDRLEEPKPAPEPKPEPKPAPEPKVALGPRHLRRR
jgi:hypothetical protein